MGEGVDPTQMCQTLVHKVARSKQLMAAVADPDILALFESWLDELEEEVAAYLRQHPGGSAAELAGSLGLSINGADFLLAKLRREKKIHR
ncbi:MAG: hypothetical protein RBR09_00550 [Desulfobulbaceae bacterium]|jgi:hypothetical protein|nr:hypothetical protein [Desulfobulbaceae bacterium]MDY0349720.1 hypothetical protein [Desulfobulbaceae bacterium]